LDKSVICAVESLRQRTSSEECNMAEPPGDRLISVDFASIAMTENDAFAG